MVVMGLGNPGRSYAATRHNVGFRVTDCMAERLGLRLKQRRGRRYALARTATPHGPLVLVQPLTFMNSAGDVVRAVLDQSDATPDELVVICDTMDLPPGASRLRMQGSSAGNRGLESVLRALRGHEVKRIYVGVGRPPPGVPVVDYVLARPRRSDAVAIDQAVTRVCERLDLLVAGDYPALMNQINVKQLEPGNGNDR